MDAEACSDPALVGAATPGDMTVVATTDAVNRTPSPHTSSTDRRLKRFIERVTKARQPSLLELPGVDTVHGGCAPLALPKRSKQIAAQSMSHIPASKRGEHIILKRLRLTSGMSSPSKLVMKAYQEIFSGDPDNM